MSPHALDKTGTRHTDTQWKVKGGEGREQKLLNAPHIQLLLPAPLMNKPCGPEHEEFHACASILIPLTQLTADAPVYLVKLRLTSFKKIMLTWVITGPHCWTKSIDIISWHETFHNINPLPYYMETNHGSSEFSSSTKKTGQNHH